MSRRSTTPQPEAHPEGVAISALVDGEVSPARRLALARHLLGCERCRAWQQRMNALAAQLSALPAAEEPEGFEAQVMERVRAVPAPRRTTAALRLVAPLLLLVAGGATAVVLHSGTWFTRGLGRILRPEALDADQLLEMVARLAIATLGGFGRAVEGLVPRLPALPAFHPPSAPGPVLLVGLAASGLILAGMAMAAWAGRGWLRARSPRA